MKRPRIVALIILLILSAIGFALAAPLVRGIPDVRVDVVDVAEDVATASRNRWIPSDKWRTNAADGTNTPSSPGSSDSDHWLEHELRPHDPRLPMDLNPSAQRSLGSTDRDNSHPLPVVLPPPTHNSLPLDIDSNAPPHPSLGSRGSDNSRPLPVGSPPPVHNNLQLDIDPSDSPHSSPSVNTHPHPLPLPVGLPQPAQNNLPLNIDLNASPQPSPSVNTHPHPSPVPVGLPPPAQNNLPLNIDLNASPQPSQEPADGPDSGSHSTGSSIDDYDSASLSWSSSTYGSHSTGPSTQSSYYHPTGSESSSDGISPWEWYEIWAIAKSPSSSPLHDSNPPPRHGSNLHIDLNRPLSVQGSTDDQPPPAPQHDPGPSTSDPGPSARPYPPLDPPSTSGPGPSTPHPPSSRGPLRLESEKIFSDLFRGRFKRRIPLLSLSRRPPNFPSHKHPDIELLQFND